MQIPGGGKEREQRDLGQKVKSSRRDFNAIRNIRDRKSGKGGEANAKERRVGEKKKGKRKVLSIFISLVICAWQNSLFSLLGSKRRT